MDDQCVLCPSSLFYYAPSKSEPTGQERYELFHQPCSACSLTKSLEESMCDFCQHLRLKHLIRCVKPEIRMRLLFPLRKELVDNHVVTKCPLCRFVNHMIVVGLGAERISQVRATGSYDVVLFLGPPQDSQWGPSGLPSADIYVSSSDTDGSSNIWVGDLHIDDGKKGKACRSILYNGYAKRTKDSAVPPVGEMLSWACLKDRINECYEAHGECKRDAGDCLPKGFRVIDVIRRCLVEISDCRFVALSYVWGAKARSSLLAASRATIHGMKKDGGLPTSGMPRTIEDAITVCVQMGQRYLWVDRLCIVQDDGEDKKNQIEAMNEIFSSAHIVLIAAYGDSMDCGLPGVGHPRKAVQHSEDILGLRITNVIREVEDDPFALWDTRGWTYQEAVLARRRLYLTNTRAFFECGRLMCHEDQFNAEKSRDALISNKLAIPEHESRFQSFVRHLEHYTSRKLTYRSDAYKALYGISNSLYNGKNMIISGLPRVDFDRGLLWYPDIGKNSITRLETQGAILPTWSWSSIMSLSDQARYRATNFSGTLVPWYDINSPSPSGSIEPCNVHPDCNPDDDWQVHMAIACRDGCVENISLPFSLTTINFSTVRKMFNARWKDYHMFCMEAIPLAINASELPQAKGGVISHNTKPGAIATRCQEVFLRLAPKPSFSFDIINSEGGRIGELCGDTAKLREQAASPTYDTSVKFEFIALSLSSEKIMAYSEEKLRPKNYIDVDGKSLPRVPIVNVLMIAWEGAFAQRRELGWIYLIDWAKLRREWKTIILE